MYIVGIDPGLTGGLAVIPQFAFSDTCIYETKQHSIPIFKTILSQLKEDGPVEVFIESPSLNPYTSKGGFRNSQAFTKLARSLGQWEGLCQGLELSQTLVSPMKWQNYLNCRTGGDKTITRTLATNIFDFLYVFLKNGKKRPTVTHATADALLIALYGYLQYPRKKQYIPKTILVNLKDSPAVINLSGVPNKRIPKRRKNNELI